MIDALRGPWYEITVRRSTDMISTYGIQIPRNEDNSCAYHSIILKISELLHSRVRGLSFKSLGPSRNSQLF